MFETNVFGLARLTQLVLPAMREARSGRVVNIGSMGGRFTFPVGGYYHATKYAVEAITDALRNEVHGFGIGVSLVEPGLIRTELRADRPHLRCRCGTTAASPYAALLASSASNTTGGYGNPMVATGPEAVAKVIVRAIEARHPKPRYVVTPAARALIATRTLGGDRVWDFMVRQQFNEAVLRRSRLDSTPWSPPSNPSPPPSSPTRRCAASPSCSNASAPAPTGSRRSATPSSRCGRPPRTSSAAGTRPAPSRTSPGSGSPPQRW